MSKADVIAGVAFPALPRKLIRGRHVQSAIPAFPERRRENA